jgi:SAM-dependent methyltransferase
MDFMQLLVDLHRPRERQGPGDEKITHQAIEIAGLDPKAPLNIADIGCGTGASSLVLAESLNAQITAVDFLEGFLEELKARAGNAGVSDRITPLACAMNELPFEQRAFDVIWSEGAIYNMGFAAGVHYWKQFLKPDGILAVSEITWLTDTRPEEVEQYWHAAYPEIDTAAAKIRVLEEEGYSPVGYFTLPDCCWLENYYLPLQAASADFLQRHGDSEEARAIVQEGEDELDLYRRFGDYFSYGMYIARKR